MTLRREFHPSAVLATFLALSGCAVMPDGRIVLGPAPKADSKPSATKQDLTARRDNAQPDSENAQQEADLPPEIADAQNFASSIQSSKRQGRPPTRPARYNQPQGRDPNALYRDRTANQPGQVPRQMMTEGEAYAAFQTASAPRGAATGQTNNATPVAEQQAQPVAPSLEAPHSAPTLIGVSAHASARPQPIQPVGASESISINGGDRLIVTGPSGQPTTALSNSTTAFQSALDARMMAAIRGDYTAAREPIPLTPKAQQETAAALIEALIAIRDRDGGSFDAGGALSELERFRDKLRDIAELQIPNLKICWRVDDFGRYEEIKPARFVTGTAAQFVVYAELRNIAGRRSSDGAWESRFSMTTRVLSMNGQAVIEPLEDRDIVDRCQNRREDFFVARRVTLPATLSPGQYVVLVTATDEIGSKVAEQRAVIDITSGR
ncbi:MAG: hypothetical protein KDA32_05690 [Phycisphaerales bacterium]|nr:hypothetical protein [Phycisphaerales bacterium]